MGKRIEHTSLVGVVKKRRGFSGANTGRSGSTAPWSRLEKVGRAMINDESPFSGSIRLLIRQGGIADKNLIRYYKTIFREDVFPAIKAFDPNCGNIFCLILHFNSDLLMHAELEYIA